MKRIQTLSVVLMLVVVLRLIGSAHLTPAQASIEKAIAEDHGGQGVAPASVHSGVGLGAITPAEFGAFGRRTRAEGAFDLDTPAVADITKSPFTPAATLTVNSTADTPDANPGNGICADSLGACTLRAAIQEANALAGLDTIQFNIGTGTPTIAPSSALPQITDPVIIDGAGGGATRVELNGASAGSPVTGLFITGGGSTVRNMVINRFQQHGILLGINGNNTLEGNYIGTDATGTVDLGNSGNGVTISDSTNNTVGGATAATRNVISGNEAHGVFLFSCSSNTVEGNFIGTDVTGTADLGNSAQGVVINGSINNTIGGATAGARNVISGNGANGVLLFGLSDSSGNKIEGNYIGTDVTGAAALANSTSGVVIEGVTNNTVGGTTAGARNVISGNVGNGVVILSSSSTGNKIEGNFIGVQADGASPLPNSASGVYLSGDNNNTVGGTTSGASNTIAFNGLAGVAVTFGVGNRIQSNSIFSNGGLGIDLNDNGVTANDACDPDTGPNNRQNFPLLTSAVENGGSITVAGSLNSTAGALFTIQLFSNAACDPSGFGEGQTFIGSTTVTTDTNCGGSFGVTLPVGIPAGQFITATATDPAGNTSEFSQCATVTAGTATIGVYFPGNETFYLRNSNTPGFADFSIPYGPSGAMPIVGDWDGNGTTTIGVYDPSSQTFYLRNSNSIGFADLTVRYGPSGAVPIVGDWDGNGTTTIGVYDPTSQTFYLRNSNSPGFADLTIRYGPAGAVPVAGDWDGNGTTTIGVYDPSSQTFYLRNSNTIGFADLTIGYGPSGATPVVGDWDGNGTVTIGVYDPGSQTFYLRNSNSIGFADLTIRYGPSGATPLAGDWDGL